MERPVGSGPHQGDGGTVHDQETAQRDFQTAVLKAYQDLFKACLETAGDPYAERLARDIFRHRIHCAADVRRKALRSAPVQKADDHRCAP
jgi:hypothetical protein